MSFARAMWAKPMDWLLLAVFVLLWLASFRFMHADAAATAAVYADGRLLGRWPLAALAHPVEVRAQGPLGETIVRITPKGVRIVASACTHQYCVASGWHRRVGDAAVCVPNRVVAAIEGGKRLDAIVW